MKYPFEEIELKWQKYWEENQVYKTDFKNDLRKLFSLVMFIYPSGAKLHCGHWYNYGPADSWSRFRKLRGDNVFEPFGFDAFGLPAENFAIKSGVHPYDSTMKNIEDIKGQLKRIGTMYDWSGELMTCSPEYYKWNQWLFLKLYEKGLAYRKNAPVNWCESCNTVLANEQVLADGTCERCSSIVIQKNLTQWFFKITEYAERLLDGLDRINWPEETKTKQRNWIGKSTGAEIIFKVENSDSEIKVFTTRPDTLFGVTYIVMAPEHPLVDKLTTAECSQKVKEYVQNSAYLTEIERTSQTKEKSGVEIGAFAINPATGEKVPVWIADYALLSYGTGCVMAVPGHDERDFEFAQKYKMEVKKVILQPGTGESDVLTEAYTGEGTMINSGKFNGIRSTQGILEVIKFLEESGFGKGKTNYKLRDWLISRQRYWGTPIPIIHCEKCGEQPVPIEQLPVELPYDIQFKPTGESPLRSHPEFMNVKCPKCGGNAKRDPDTMDTFVDSSWYYFRYCSPKYAAGMFDEEITDKWVPVDMYIGGREHSTMHLLYSRFIHKFMFDLGMAKTDEPFKRLVHQGTITNMGAKMSKSKGNIVIPEPFIDKYGSDVFRLYLMFMGPYEMGGDWSDKGITGTERFVQRIYDLAEANAGLLKNYPDTERFDISHINPEEKGLYTKLHKTIEKIEYDIENLKFNTAIAAMMELTSEMVKHISGCSNEFKAHIFERMLILIAPLAPHLAEECGEILGRKGTIYENPVWYEADKNALIDETVNYAIQISGKLRGTILMPIESTQEEVYEAAKSDPRISKFLEEKEIIKQIFVKNKILNLVVKP
ncbi:MAG: leucine--tRNA ligase [Ignavibacteriaceae bacterium]|nr:leucine--tRNA ligase [Ignavibacteriaceae bacterium]